jgi:hypothetical protein
VQKYPSWRDESTKGTQQPAADPCKQSNYDVNVNVNVAAELNEKRERESPISGLIAPSSARRERGSKDESISNHDVPLSQRLLLFYPSHQPCWRSLRHCVGFKLQPAFDGPLAFSPHSHRICETVYAAQVSCMPRSICLLLPNYSKQGFSLRALRSPTHTGVQ